MKGDIPTYERGRILGHEGVGVIDKIGAGVRNFEHGDRVTCVLHFRIRNV
jgi:alcohol dehydrogenase